MRRWLRVLAVVIFVALTACGDGAKSSSAARGESKANPDGRGVQGKGERGLPGLQQSRGAVSQSNASTPAPTLPTGATVTTLSPDYIFGGPVTQDRTDETPPRGCSMKRGSQCFVRWEGTYRLRSAETATILFGIYEDGATTPAFSTRLPNARPPGSRFFNDHFIWVVSKTAKSVTFRVTLLGDGDRVIAAGPDHRFAIP